MSSEHSVGSSSRFRLIRIVGLGALAILLASCASTGSGDNRLQVAATTSMLGDVVANIVGDDAEVTVLIPIGTDPHDFDPSSRQVAEMSAADLVVANGLGLEEGLSDLLAGLSADGVEVLTLGPLLDPISFGSRDEQPVAGDDPGSLDPHVWLDPVRMSEAAELIGVALAGLDSSVDWKARVERYQGELASLHTTITAMFDDIPVEDRLIVTNHDSLGYFAERYELTVVGTVVPGGSTLGNPSSEELAGLVDLMSDLGVTAIFADSTEPAALAEVLAGELGENVVVVELYTGSLGESGSGADTLVSMIATDAERISSALGRNGQK